MEPIRSMRELLERALAGGRRRVAVPAAESQSALDAVLEARARGLAAPILIGDRAALEAELAARGEDAAHLTLLHEPEAARAARRAVELVRAGQAEVLLKGRLSTGV